MKRIFLPIAFGLAALLLFSPAAYSADLSDNRSTTLNISAVAEDFDIDASIVGLVSDLLEKDVRVSLNNSTALVVACNPFLEMKNPGEDLLAEIKPPESNISVGLSFSF